MADVTERMEVAYDVNAWIAADPKFADLVTGLGQEDPDVFYPVQQDPQGGFPYVRYTSSTFVSADTHWMHGDDIMYALFFNKVSDSAYAMNIIMNKVKAGDESADDLNRWIDENRYRHYIYHSLEWMSGGSTEPTSERGGAHGRLITFRVMYSPVVGAGIV